MRSEFHAGKVLRNHPPETSRRRKLVKAKPSAGTANRAETQAARTIGAQSIGSRSRPCQALNCVGSRYGRRKSSAEMIPSSCMINETMSVVTTAAAELRVTVESRIAIDATAKVGRK